MRRVNFYRKEELCQRAGVSVASQTLFPATGRWETCRIAHKSAFFYECVIYLSNKNMFDKCSFISLYLYMLLMWG